MAITPLGPFLVDAIMEICKKAYMYINKIGTAQTWTNFQIF